MLIYHASILMKKRKLILNVKFFDLLNVCLGFDLNWFSFYVFKEILVALNSFCQIFLEIQSWFIYRRTTYQFVPQNKTSTDSYLVSLIFLQFFSFFFLLLNHFSTRASLLWQFTNLFHKRLIKYHACTLCLPHVGIEVHCHGWSVLEFWVNLLLSVFILLI